LLNLNKIKNKTMFTSEIHNYYIMDYPNGYNPNYLPHENSLESALNYCKEHNYSGVTFQHNRYEVRSGKYIKYYNGTKTISWIYI
jgi:hypothetical protein